MRKNVFVLVISILLLVPFVSTNAASKARTLRELRAELASWKKEQAANESKKMQQKMKLVVLNNLFLVNKQKLVIINKK